MHDPLALNVGCGRKKRPGAVNLDVSAEVEPDVIHDLDQLPWPFEDDRFAEIHAYDVVEHLHDLVAVLGEMHRICRPGGVVHITVPHFSSANSFSDPTHRHYFAAQSFGFLEEGHPLSFYGKARFAVRTRQILFHPSWPNKVVSRLANRRPEAYERRWAWVFPAWFLYFQLEAQK